MEQDRRRTRRTDLESKLVIKRLDGNSGHESPPDRELRISTHLAEISWLKEPDCSPSWAENRKMMPYRAASNAAAMPDTTHLRRASRLILFAMYRLVYLYIHC